MHHLSWLHSNVFYLSAANNLVSCSFPSLQVYIIVITTSKYLYPSIWKILLQLSSWINIWIMISTLQSQVSSFSIHYTLRGHLYLNLSTISSWNILQSGQLLRQMFSSLMLGISAWVPIYIVILDQSYSGVPPIYLCQQNKHGVFVYLPSNTQITK